MGRLEGKVSIVTGAARGLGRVFALKLAEEGSKVLGVDVKIEELQKVGEEARRRGLELETLYTDVSKVEDTKRMAEEAFKKFGQIDVLVNNAAYLYGIGRRPFYEIDPQEFDRMLAVNVKGVWLCSVAVFPYMRERRQGKIINLASEVFFTGSHGVAHYVASKGGVIGLTRALAAELGPYNICVNAIAPGFTATEAAAGLSELSKYDVSLTPLGRIGTPEDLVGALLYLASDESAFVTGQVILIDGGRVKH